jgi:RNA polymerase sigma-70 factor (ECF subfamily)
MHEESGRIIVVRTSGAEPIETRAQAGRTLDFRTIFDTYGLFVLRTLRKLGVPSADLNDLCQETFVVVHRRLPDYDGRASLRTWIYAICARTASAHRRSIRARREDACANPEPFVTNTSHDTTPPDLDIDARRAVAEIEALLASLDDEKRKIVVLHEIEGLSMSKIAGAVGCPLQTAYSRLHAARKAMRVSLERRHLHPTNRA